MDIDDDRFTLPEFIYVTIHQIIDYHNDAQFEDCWPYNNNIMTYWCV